MKLRRVRPRSGGGTPRVAVRAQMPWYWRTAGLAAILAVSFALAAWILDFGWRVPGVKAAASTHETQALRTRIAELEEQLQRFQGNTEAERSRLTMERSAQEQLALQVRALEQENTRLREELAFFDNLAATQRKNASLSINRLSVEPDSVPGQFRYRMLLTFLGDKKDQEFKGAMQLLVHLQQDGKSAMIILPSAKDKDRQRFEISFRHYRRVDGQFQVPSDALVKSVEVRLLQDGVTKASQSVVL